MFVLDICCQQFGEYMSVEYTCSYWIYHANTWGMNVSWMVSGVGVYTFLKMYICIDCDDNNFGILCQLNIYMLVLDITCQQLGDECKLEGFCVPFGHRVVECTFLKMYICIGYVMSTIFGACVS